MMRLSVLVSGSCQARRLARTLAASVALACIVCGGAFPQAPIDESLPYDWRLSGFLGFLARAFVPSGGEATLTTRLDQNGLLTTELHVTSRQKTKGDFWRYGSEIDTPNDRPLRAWSSYSFRGKTKERERPIEKSGVVEIASLIHRIRQTLPQKKVPLKLWWDGKTYPIVIVPKGSGTRPYADHQVEAQLYEIRGEPGAEPRLKGQLRLWIAVEDDRPLELSFSRLTAKVRFRLSNAAEQHTPKVEESSLDGGI